MIRLLTAAALLAAAVSVPTAEADAGPVQRFREWRAQRKATPAPQAQPQAPAPKVAQQAAPAPKVVEGPVRDRAKLALLRILAVQHAVEHGVPNGDGTFKKVTRAQARAYADKVTDEQILKGATVYGAPVAEGRLESFFDWILEHKEEIAELVRWIVSLFALFADEEPSAAEVWPVEAVAEVWRVVVVAVFPSGVAVAAL